MKLHTKSKMKIRVFIIHGWGGSPTKDWIPWVKFQLEVKGYEVSAPTMPDTDNPQIEPWVNKLSETIKEPQKQDVLIGHSIGCQTILRFLEGLPENQKVSKVILVAPWFKLTNLENDEAWKIVDPWIKSQIEFSKVKSKSDSFTAIFSNNDQWVPLKENKELFERRLNPRIIVLNNKGHFSEEEGVKELSEVIDLI